MGGQSNLYVFEKKEAFLIFLFMILASLTSFMLGVKVGKSYFMEDNEPIRQDRQSVDMLSGQEEAVDETLRQRQEEEAPSRDEIRESIHRKLEKEIADELSDDGQTAADGGNDEAQASSSVPLPEALKDRSGKYTIQLASYRSMKEARMFADGFKIKGYEPIIQMVELEDRGRWFRVSLGEFDNIAAAKEYVANERELFMGQDYVFGQF